MSLSSKILRKFCHIGCRCNFLVVCLSFICLLKSTLKIYFHIKDRERVPNVARLDTGVRKGVGTSGAVKSIIPCVHLLVNLNSMCIKTAMPRKSCNIGCRSKYQPLCCSFICLLKYP